MSRLFDQPVTVWAAVLVLALPALIVAAGELQERLRRRGSPFEKPAGTVRNLIIPVVALWALLVFVVDVGRDIFWAQIVATVAVLALAAAVLQVLRPLVLRARAQGKTPGKRAAPELLLMIPRLAVVLVAGWLLVGQVWNVNLTGLFAALGVFSLVVSLALQSTLSGLASGLLLLGDRPFNPGDWIRVNADLEGQVVDIHWRSTRIRTRDGDLVVVPNATLADAEIVNFTEPTRLHRIKVPVQVAFSNPPTAAVDMLLAAARATPGVLSDPAPEIRVVQVDDPLMGYEAHLWVDDYAAAPAVASDFGSLVWYHSHRMGVPLPSPAFDLYHHDPVQEAADAEIGPEQLAEHIGRAPLLAEITVDDRERLAASASRVRFSQGELILASGAVNRDLYLLDEGRAWMSLPGFPGSYVELAAGDVVSLLGRAAGTAAAEVVAVTDCEVVVIAGDVAGAVTSRNPQLAAAMNQLMELRGRRLGVAPVTAAGGEPVGGAA
jgi:small-conductance mechanosensitive channel